MLLGFFFPSDFVLVLPSIILLFPSVASSSLPLLSHSSRRSVASLDHEEAVLKDYISTSIDLVLAVLGLMRAAGWPESFLRPELSAFSAAAGSVVLLCRLALRLGKVYY